MLSNIGVPGLILILVLALIIFGPKKLPEMGRAMGQTLREFKNSTKGMMEDNNNDRESSKPKATEAPKSVKEDKPEEKEVETEKTKA